MPLLTGIQHSGTGSSQGITKAGVGVESINCEFTEADEIQAAVENVMDLSSALPRLRAYTQVQTALGIVSTAAKSKLAGVFGSMAGVEKRLMRLKANYRMHIALALIRFGSSSNPLMLLQQCKEGGLILLFEKAKKIRALANRLVAQIDRTEQAVGRVVGSLCSIC